MTAPAATLMSCPVRLFGADEQRKRTVSTTSSSLTFRLNVVPSVISLRNSSGVSPRSRDIDAKTSSSREPSTSQGEITLTLMPYGPTSCASVLDRPTTPSLAAAYGVRLISGCLPVTEPMLTIFPCSACFRYGSAALHERNTPVRLTATVSFHSSSVISLRGA